MQRDMDLVRSILFAVEAKETAPGIWMKDFDVPNVPDSSERRGHFLLMTEAGFFACEPIRSTSNPDRIHDVMVFDLSWKGHEYLDAIRDPKVWRKTKDGLKKVGGASFEILIETAKALARDALRNVGIPIAI